MQQVLSPPSPPPPLPVGPPPAAPAPHRPRTLLRWRTALVLAAIGASALIDATIFVGVVVLFCVVVPFEKLYPRRREQRLRRPLVGTDLGFALLSPLLNVVGVFAIVLIGGLSLVWVPGLALRPLVALIPPALLPIAGFLLFDLAAYWAHRFAHEVPFLWRFHAVHHSPRHMDWVSGFRVHPFDGVLAAPGFFLLIGAGFDPALAGGLVVFQIILGLFFHANVRVRWRWLDRVACNPEFHHWHHSSEPDAIGHNYGTSLPWWDLCFGTFFMPHHRTGRRPARYGIDEPLPDDIVGQLTHPCRGARSHLWLWRHPIVAGRTLYRATRNLLADMRRSATRPTHAIRRTTTPGTTSTNASLLGPAAVARRPRRPLPARAA